ncbi:hypothetical protein OWR29_06640 [Actinoplanes sp. Pm04-4]|uniref:Uncharacterized protein n=1 Tax=Paractinoplanes pyxinae TaxID=2997416 RepID=A0ABT4ATU5_9ACTN|nr:hypothetical protein [Actinoplanes pyxinae]MCY1137671.1 hypothetical protein [Actinoplanes pyxinae]
MNKAIWLRITLSGVLLLTLTSACTRDKRDRKEAAAPAPNIQVTVQPDAPTKLTTDGVTVILPAGASKAGTTVKLTVDSGPPPPSVPAGITVVGRKATVELPGRLAKPATVTFPAPRTIADGTLRPVVVWQNATGAWRWTPTTYKAGAATVTATVDHFSGGFLGGIDVQKWIKDRGQAVKNYATGRSGVSQPSCGDEKAARAGGLRVSSDQGDRVKWCFGLQDGKRVLKVANNTRTYQEITYPAGWKVVGGGSASFNADTVARAFGMAASTPRGKASRIIDGGDTLALSVPAGATGRVRSELSTTAWLVSAIWFGAEVYKMVADAAGDAFAAAAKGALDRFALVLGMSGEADPVDGLKECLKGVSDLTEMTADTGREIVKFAFKCVPAIMKSQLDDVQVWAAGTIVSMIGTLVGTILTGVNLLASGARDIWDSIASFGGGSDVLYDIAITAPTTKVTGADLARAGCPGCRLTGQIPFNHPAWGPSALVVALSEETSDLLAFDSAGKVRWRRHYDRMWYEGAPARPGTDATGNLFVNFNPGRYNGVIVLRPVADGFQDFATLPDLDSGYAERFYSARLVLNKSTNTYKVRSELNDCEPDCASGTIHVQDYHYNGKDYVPR